MHSSRTLAARSLVVPAQIKPYRTCNCREAQLNPESRLDSVIRLLRAGVCEKRFQLAGTILSMQRIEGMRTPEDGTRLPSAGRGVECHCRYRRRSRCKQTQRRSGAQRTFPSVLCR
ncbi:hypothetical protein LIA77_07004 [Sarocladium implicatum]|nr:hypothetical protein LIA77_07004 [Sarocladium implicatum]